MTETLNRIQPAQPREVNVYLPYYQGSKRNFLPLAISLYHSGNFEGQRGIEGNENIPFIATWNISTLPADLTRCRVQFESSADLSYEITMTNFEFIGFLIEVLTNFKRTGIADFSKSFYRKLLKLED
jgi:hypothetical protein